MSRENVEVVRAVSAAWERGDDSAQDWADLWADLAASARAVENGDEPA